MEGFELSRLLSYTSWVRSSPFSIRVFIINNIRICSLERGEGGIGFFASSRTFVLFPRILAGRLALQEHVAQSSALPNSAVLPSQNGGSPRTRSAEFPALLPLKEFVTRPCLANSPVLPSRKGFEGEAVLRKDPKAQKLALSRAQGPACNLFTCFATLATPRLCVRSFWLSKGLLTPSGAANRRVGPGGAELRARKPGPGYRLAPSASGAIAAYVRCPG